MEEGYYYFRYDLVAKTTLTLVTHDKVIEIMSSMEHPSCAIVLDIIPKSIVSYNLTLLLLIAYARRLGFIGVAISYRLGIKHPESVYDVAKYDPTV